MHSSFTPSLNAIKHQGHVANTVNVIKISRLTRRLKGCHDEPGLLILLDCQLIVGLLGLEMNAKGQEEDTTTPIND